MRAGVWFTAGAAAGVYGMVRVRRLAEALTPDGMRDRVGAAVVGARLLRDEVAQGQAEAETRLRERYRALESGARRVEPRPELPHGADSPHRTDSTAMTATLAAPHTTEEDGRR